MFYMSEKIMVCPRCNSRSISTDGSFAFEQKCGMNRWMCDDCEYSGIMTVMAPEEHKKLKVRNVKKN